jgi:polar amino acid transport system substrate-binding protein
MIIGTSPGNEKMNHIAFVAALVFSCALNAAERPPESSTAMVSMRTSLAPTGTLRVAFLGTNPVQGRVDAATGKVTGPVADLMQELARRLEVPYQLIPVPDVRGVIGHLQAGSADIGFLAYDESRAAVVDFSGAYAQMLSSYVVPEGSSIKASADVDREGLVIGAVKGVSQELYISSHLRHAKVRLFTAQPSWQELEKLIANGEIAAFGMNRQRALDMDQASTNLRALDDSFLDVAQEFAVAKGSSVRFTLESFAAELRSSGFIKASLDKAGLQDSTRVP